MSPSPKLNIARLKGALVRKKNENLRIMRLNWPRGELRFQLGLFLSCCCHLIFFGSLVWWAEKDLQTAQRPRYDWGLTYLCPLHCFENADNKNINIIITIVVNFIVINIYESPQHDHKKLRVYANHHHHHEESRSQMEKKVLTPAKKCLHPDSHPQMLKLTKMLCFSG